MSASRRVKFLLTLSFAFSLVAERLNQERKRGR